MGVYYKLADIQFQLKVPKMPWNSFSNFAYRNMDDILLAVKPMLHEMGLVLLLTDEVVNIGGENYVQAFATLVEAETGEKVQVSALAREAKEKKGMDAAQITGTSSTYARKYALNALFALDNDAADPDAMDNTPQSAKNTGKQNNQSNSNNIQQANKQPQNAPNQQKGAVLSEKQINRLNAKMRAAGMTTDDVIAWIKQKFRKQDVTTLNYKEYDELCAALDNAARK